MADGRKGSLDHESSRTFALSMLIVFVLAGIVLLWWPQTWLPTVDSRQDTMPDMPGMASQSRSTIEEPRPNPNPESSAGPSESPGVVSVPMERLQMIGVKYQPVARRPLEKVIRTVGRVAVDERKLGKVTIKFHGWIEELFVARSVIM